MSIIRGMHDEIYYSSPLINREDSRTLAIVIEKIDEGQLIAAELSCDRIQEIYAKNIGYLIISLMYISKFNITHAKTLLAKASTSTIPSSGVEDANSFVAATLTEAESLLKAGNFERFSPWWPDFRPSGFGDKLRTHHPLLQRALRECVLQFNLNIQAAQEYNDAVIRAKNSLSATATASAIENRESRP